MSKPSAKRKQPSKRRTKAPQNDAPSAPYTAAELLDVAMRLCTKDALMVFKKRHAALRRAKDLLDHAAVVLTGGAESYGKTHEASVDTLAGEMADYGKWLTLRPNYTNDPRWIEHREIESALQDHARLPKTLKGLKSALHSFEYPFEKTEIEIGEWRVTQNILEELAVRIDAKARLGAARRAKDARARKANK